MAECMTTKATIDNNYSFVPCASNNVALESIPIDAHSMNLLPEEYKCKFVPLQTEGDGNCLYRYVYYPISCLDFIHILIYM